MATNEPSRTPGAPTLRGDERGAVLVVGVFMATLLVGAIWYMIGIGDALVYREFLQDGADATSFASAVYHARGMNALVMLNVVMAAIFAVLVALHVAHAIAMIILIVSCGFAWTGAGAAICISAGTAAIALQSKIDAVGPIVQAAVASLHAASDAVSRATPAMATVRAVQAAKGYRPIVEGGVAVSSSMTRGGAGQLPVEDDDPEVLIEHAGFGLASVITAPLGSFGIPTGRINRVLSYGVEALYRFDGGPDPQKPSKRLVRSARNGNDELAVWGFSWGEQRKHTSAKSGLKVATYGKIAPRDPSEASRYGSAKSEYYYDVRGDFPAWDSYEEDVMWNMRWRARMRRFTDPGAGILGAAGAGGALAGFVSNPASLAGQAGLGRGALLGRLEWLH